MGSNANNSAKNVIFTSLELSKLLKNTENENSTPVDVIAVLKESYLSADSSVAASALHVMTILVERGSLSLAEGFGILISLLTSSKQPAGALVPAVGRLLLLEASRPNWKCPYNISDHPHPLVSILRHNWDAWDGVSAFLSSVFSSTSDLQEDKKMAVVHPVISAVMLDPAAPLLAKTQILRLLVSVHHEESLLELLAWHRVDMNWCWLVREFLLEVIERRPSKCTEYVEAVTPALAEAVAWLTARGHDPTLWIDLLGHCLTVSSAPVDVVLFVLAEVIPMCPTVYLLPIAELCKVLVLKGDASVFSASAVAAATLRWALYSSLLTKGLTEKCQKILDNLPNLSASTKSQKLMENRLFNMFLNSSKHVRLEFDVALLTHQWGDTLRLVSWLEGLSARKAYSSVMLRRLQPLLLAISLQAKAPQVIRCTLKLLKEAVSSDSSFAFPVLCVILHKLSQEADPNLLLDFLKLVPQMSVDKENVPLVLGTIQSLQNGDPDVMVSLRMVLLLELWTLQPRTFPYLIRLLQVSPRESKKGFEIQLARAMALLEICHRSPDTHGKEVVGLLSDVLNGSDGQSGARASALALDAITVLCKANVVDFMSIWVVLAPKMRQENRPAVVSSVCRLLAVSADSGSDSSCKEAIARLWMFVESDCAVLDALTTLGHFPVHCFDLKSLPSRFRRNLTIPKDLIAKEGLQSPEEVLTYVPGECLIQLLEKIDDRHLKGAEEMVTRLLKKEVAGLPRGIYSLPLGVQEPSTLAHLPPSSVLRALIKWLQTFSRKEWVSSRLCLSVLRVLCVDYLRPYPPFDWSFLRPGFADEICREHVVTLCALQGRKSPSAQKLVQEFVDLLSVDDKSAALILSVLPDVAQYVKTSSLAPLVNEVLRTSLADNAFFGCALNAVRRTVALAIVPEPNRNAVANAVKSLLVDLPPDLENTDAVWECVSELPHAIVDRLTCPRLWPEVTSHRLHQALRVRRALVLKPQATGGSSLLDGFTEIIDVVCSREGDQRAVLDQLVIVLRLVNPESSRIWFRMLMARLLATVSGSNPAEGHLFLLELVLLSSAVLSGTDLLLSDPARLTEDHEVQLRLFPTSLLTLFATPDTEWCKVLPYVVEALHVLSKSDWIPSRHRSAMEQGLLALRFHDYCLAPTRWPRLFYKPPTS